MKSRKKIIILLSLFTMFFLASGYTVPTIPDFEGNWYVSFYNAAGKLQGSKTLTISEDGTFSGNAILIIDNVIYQTEISGIVSNNGAIREGTLTDVDKLEMEGIFKGIFLS